MEGKPPLKPRNAVGASIGQRLIVKPGGSEKIAIPPR
jgi:hypothetical protein